MFIGSDGQTAKSSEQVEKERFERVQGIIDVIQTNVEPDTWSEGQPGTVRELTGQLIITQTPRAHELVGSLLKQLRFNAGLVRVQADWVVLTPEQVATIVTRPGGEKQSQTPKVVDAARLTSLGAETPHYRGEIACFSGQTVSIDSGRSRTVVYDAEPVVAQNAVAVNPGVRQVMSGVMLEVTPLIVGDTETAIVQVRSAYAEWGKPDKAEMTYSSTQPGGSNVQGPTSIDRLNVLRQELRTAARIPLNQAVLVGGMTLEPMAQTPQGSQLYLILQVTAAR
jgi:hypothetical protein